jgi:transposase
MVCCWHGASVWNGPLAASALLLLPEGVDDYVGPDNPVRFIEAFVDGFDLGAAGFVRVQPKATGRPGYDPADLLKLYIYGYLNRIRSSRRLETETHRNIEVIWLLRYLKPDFKTIADFRRDNRSAFKTVFRAFVVLCRKLDLYGRELLAVDGTRLKAVNSRTRNFTKAKLDKYIKSADERLEKYLAQLDDADRGEEAGTTRRSEALAAKIARVREQRQVREAMLEQSKASGESQISLTDPDARAMAAHPKIGVGYNAQVAVDAKHKLIVEQHVTNAGSDLGFLAETAGAAKDLLGVEQIDAVADMGYYMGEDIAACERAGITPYVARPQRGTAVGDGRFPKERFRYDEAADCYHCPGDQRLDTRYRWLQGGHIIVQYSNPRACGGCELKAQCARGDFRRITRWEGEAVLDSMAIRLAARPEILNIRRETVEHPFGSIKQWMNQGAFLMRGLDKVRAEFSLTALAYNLRRAINLVGVQELIRAVQT